MKTWFISDTHFFHRNIGAYCHRPDDWHDLILENLKCVGPDDVLYHLGDVAFRHERQEVADLVAKLPGREKILIEGNHDRRSKIRREPVWASVTRYHDVFCHLDLIVEPIVLEMTHNPEDFVNSSADIFLHGHLHDIGEPWHWDENGKLWVNACVEQWNYKPVNLDTIRDLVMLKRISAAATP